MFCGKRALFAVAGLAALSFAGSAAAEACKIAPLVELPVTMQGLTPTVPVQVNGASVAVVPNSGGYYSGLTGSAADRLGLKVARTNLVYGDATGPTRVNLQQARAKTLSLGDQAVLDVQFAVLPERDAGAGPAGTIAQNILGASDSEYDLRGGVFRIMRAGDCAKTAMAYWSKEGGYSVIDIAPATAQSQNTIGTVYINGQKMRAAFSSGSPVSSMSRKAAARAGVRVEDAGVAQLADRQTPLGNHFKGWIASFDSFKVGNEEVRNSKLRIVDADFNGSYDILIGADFFQAHRVYFSQAQRRMYFTYNGGPVFNTNPRADDGGFAVAALTDYRIARQNMVDVASAAGVGVGIPLDMRSAGNFQPDQSNSSAAPPATPQNAQ